MQPITPINPQTPPIATDKFFNKNLFWQSLTLFWLLANYDFLLMLANKSQIIDSIRLYYGYKKCGISSNFLSFLSRHDDRLNKIGNKKAVKMSATKLT